MDIRLQQPSATFHHILNLLSSSSELRSLIWGYLSVPERQSFRGVSRACRFIANQQVKKLEVHIQPDIYEARDYYHDEDSNTDEDYDLMDLVCAERRLQAFPCLSDLRIKCNWEESNWPDVTDLLIQGNATATLKKLYIEHASDVKG